MIFNHKYTIEDLNMENTKKAELRAKHLQQKEEWSQNKDFVRGKKLFALEYKLAVQLYEARKKAGITQKEIAELLGTKQSAISRIEKGCNISIETIARYASVCGKELEFELV